MLFLLLCPENILRNQCNIVEKTHLMHQKYMVYKQHSRRIPLYSQHALHMVITLKMELLQYVTYQQILQNISLITIHF